MVTCFDSFINKTSHYKIKIGSGIEYIKEVLFLCMATKAVDYVTVDNISYLRWVGGFILLSKIGQLSDQLDAVQAKLDEQTKLLDVVGRMVFPMYIVFVCRDSQLGLLLRWSQRFPDHG